MFRAAIFSLFFLASTAAKSDIIAYTDDNGYFFAVNDAGKTIVDGVLEVQEYKVSKSIVAFRKGTGYLKAVNEDGQEIVSAYRGSDFQVSNTIVAYDDGALSAVDKDGQKIVSAGKASSFQVSK